MEKKEYLGFTPDYIDTLLPKQIFVFGSNTLGYHTGGASGTARKKFGAVWGQAEGLQGQCYAIPVDYGKNIRKDNGYEITDRIRITLAPNDDIENAVKNFGEYIMNQVLADSIDIQPNDGLEVDFDDFKLNIQITKS